MQQSWPIKYNAIIGSLSSSKGVPFCTIPTRSKVDGTGAKVVGQERSDFYVLFTVIPLRP